MAIRPLVRFRRGLVAAFVACLAAASAGGSVRAQEVPENFEIGLSTDEIGIGSDFTGARLVVFGALDNADSRIRRQLRYDIVVVLVGPRREVVVREKERTLGIWVNRGSQTFALAPASYSLASTRPLGDIAPRTLRETLSLGIESLKLSPREGPEGVETPTGPMAVEPVRGALENGTAQERVAAAEDGAYAEALRRIRINNGLYEQRFGAVRFVSPTLFRADLRLPAGLPIGQHEVRAYLFREGVYIAQSTETLHVVKTGLEAFVSRMAQDYALFYGVFAVALAIVTGWLGRIMFKRD